jgi:arsenite/tail-anchored protein-transporting ATPase
VRVLLFTGKGGVGKTTTAAATAIRLAEQGARVVVTSADPAHSLGDSFGAEPGTEPVEVTPRCFVQQIDARERLEDSWGDIREWMLTVFDWAGVAAIEAEELAVVPGLDELFALTEVESLCASGRYDVVVVDCAPTAETVRLLSLPDILGWYMERLFPASRRISRVVGPLVSRMTSLPMADDKVFAAGQRFYDQLDSVRRILADPSVTSARLVVNPERMVLAEARRTYTYLSLFGYQVDAVVVNRVLPAGASGEWVDSWRLAQQQHLCTIEEDFAPLPVFRAEHVGAEVVGLDALGRFGEALWDGVDPADRLVEGTPLQMSREADHLLLTVDLPFADRSELDLTRNGDELFVAVGPHRRNLVLPDSLRRRQIGSASLRDGRLEVTFVESGTEGT